MKNQEIAKVFNDIADILEIKGNNPFRIRAYRRAAQNIDGFAGDIAETPEEELRKIPGIGHDLAEKIKEYVTTDHLEFYEELKKEVPHSLVEMLSVPSIGPKTVKMLFEKLKINNIDELEQLAKKGELKGLPGIQAKTEENILKGIAMVRRRTDRFPIGRVLPIAEDILKKLKDAAPVKEIALAGSLRRWKDTIKDIDMLATSRDPKKVMNVFTRLPHVKEVLMKGPTKSSIVTRENIQVDLRVVEEDSVGAALAYFTGSKAHNIRLREMAVKKGLKINEYGVFDIKTNKKIGGKNEADIYKALGLPFIPPELREDTGEIEAAFERKLPELFELGDIKGDLHVHTKYSDGSHDIEELVDEARKRGYKYIAITDHSKGLGVARGMSIEKLLEQNKKIEAVNKRLKNFFLLSGVEMDIRSDGTMDYPDEVLKKLDIVVASIHSGFRQSKEQLTKRLVSAMKNPFVSIIAHPTGRLIGERDAYDVDMDEVLMTARDTGAAIEVNAYPLRLDLSDIYIRKAKGMGIPLAISTDAHVAYQFDFMRYGVGIARRGWLEKKDVLNTYPYKALQKRLKNKQYKRSSVKSR
ncbi:MAG: DNA polymerase/3'-5' exonuclease PolX [Thermodesulfovibrionia bacterium]|nr:DNA polymerase/3'-5' exonuclease PolX [Thermodesulfovibrionia bacterium]